MGKLSNNNEPLVPAEAVSEWLRISVKTLCQWAEHKKIPAIQVESQWKFREKALLDWVKSRTKQATRKLH